VKKYLFNKKLILIINEYLFNNLMLMQIWELRAYYSIIDVLFGKYEKVKEIYIPELGYSFNKHFEEINIIKTTKDRYIMKNTLTERVIPILIDEKEITTKQLNEYKNLIKLKKQISDSKIVVNVLSS
jgi:hypothetical protein